MKNHITIIGAGNLTKSLLRGMELSKVKKNINLIDLDRKKGLHQVFIVSNSTHIIQIRYQNQILFF